MCGRYSITSPTEAIQRVFQVPERPNLPARYNVAPTQDVPIVRLQGGDADEGADDRDAGATGRHLVFARWGLIPFWADDPSIGSRMINARAESAPEKPAFRAAFKRRRCLVVADGFYEWQKPAEKGGRKQPWRITLADGSPFGFAGLWERWTNPDDQSVIESCTILTTDANAKLQPIHERMPVILPPEAHATWLDPEAPSDDLKALLQPYPADAMSAFRISTAVNKVANDTPEVIRPLPADAGGGDGAGSPAPGDDDDRQARLF
jgi:putative SOS response-associated peptidase YedK